MCFVGGYEKEGNLVKMLGLFCDMRIGSLCAFLSVSQKMLEVRKAI